MTVWWVRPKLSGSHGAADGTSYADAFYGLGNVDWTATGVQPGDILRICGTHYYDALGNKDFTYSDIISPASGSAGNYYTITGDSDGNGDDGTLIGAYTYSYSDFTDNGDGTYYATCNQSQTGWAVAYGSDLTSLNILTAVGSQAECIATSGTFYLDEVGNIIYINPVSAISSLSELGTIYYKWICCWRVRSESFWKIENLNLYFGGSSIGVVSITGINNPSHQYTHITDCNIAYCTGPSIQNDYPSSYVYIERNNFWSVANTIYPYYNYGNHYYWFFRDNYIDGENQYALSPSRFPNDSHIVAAQNLSYATVSGNIMVNLLGDGILNYVDTGASYGLEWVIDRNIMIWAPGTDGYRRAIESGGSNASDFSDRTKGWVITRNLISGATGIGATSQGIGIRIKGGMAADGTRHQVYNNVFYNCRATVHIINMVDNNSGIIFKNNISYYPNNAGADSYHFKIDSITDTLSVDLANNIYYPAPSGVHYQFKYDGVLYSSIATWNAATGDNSVIANPIFDNPSGLLESILDFKIYDTGSPAYNGGVDVGLLDDFWKYPIVGLPNIGLHEADGELATTVGPTTAGATTLAPTTVLLSTLPPTTLAPTTVLLTTPAPTTIAPTTLAPTTIVTTVAPTTTLTTAAPTTIIPTTVVPTTPAPVDPGLDKTFYCAVDNGSGFLKVYTDIDGIFLNPSVDGAVLIITTGISGSIAGSSVIDTDILTIVTGISGTAITNLKRCNWVGWSKIGDTRFILDRSNDAGFRPMEWSGCVYNILQLGKNAVVYGSGGITVMYPVTGPAPTFGFKDTESKGIKNRTAVAGDRDIHYFIDRIDHLYKLTEQGLQDLDFSEFLSQLTNPVLVWDKGNRRLYISDGTTGYIVSADNMGGGYANLTGLYIVNSSLTAISPAEMDYSPIYIVTDAIDFNRRGIKTIEGIDLGLNAGDEIKVAIDYKYNKKDEFETSHWVFVNEEGIAPIRVAGVEFRVRIKSLAHTSFELDYMQIHVKYDDKRFVRGQIAGTGGKE